MTDVRLTALNPVDSQVYPVACNTSGELLVAQDDPGPDLTVTGDLTVDGTASFKNDVYIDSSGRLLVGTSSAQTLPTASSLQVSGSDFATSSIRQTRFESGTSGPSIILAHARGTEGSNQPLGNNDELGKIRFYGHDGVDFNNWGAEIKAEVDGTPGPNDMPGRLTFMTTTDGASSPTERMQIDSSGRLLLGTTTVGFNTADNLTVADSGDCGITIRSGASSSGSIYFADGTTGSAEYEGFIDYQQTAGSLRFGTGGGQERLRITSSGNVFIGGTTASSADIALNANGTATFLGDVTAPNITSLMNTVAELTNRIDILEGN